MYKLFLAISLLLLKNCSIGESFDDAINVDGAITYFPVENLSKDTIYVWYDMVYGNKRHEISVTDYVAPPHRVAWLCIYNFNINEQMNELDVNSRVDTFFVYIADKHENYVCWYQNQIESVHDESSYRYRFVLTKDNFIESIGTSGLPYGDKN